MEGKTSLPEAFTGVPLLPGFLELLDLTGPVLVPPPPEPPLDLTSRVPGLLAQTLYAALAAKKRKKKEKKRHTDAKTK